jgi:hypothetical protein
MKGTLLLPLSWVCEKMTQKDEGRGARKEEDSMMT